ncbi:ABC transporter permease subunit [Methylophaga sp.]|jgi:ABC-2 type transport system permease protein|uniref:ABC transporter permease n=1 Tax=Methylophaga sp. TaxID=2024840 RepID=UPI0013FE8ED2|nr:ABC transporter permease subunit [Methylophaga sp.]MTI64503.1 ABC transporter permease [Methylophaga sp.]
MFNIARNELHRLFLSPLAWVMLALTQLLLAYLFLTHIDYFSSIQARISAIPGAPGVTEMVAMPLLSNAAIILLLITPLLTMRTIAEERRNETLPLLASAPLSMTQIVLGKYLGNLTFFLLIALLTMLMPLSLSLGTHLDWYQLSAGMLGLVLLIASFTAIGLYMSSLTRQPTIAAVSTFALLFLLWIIDWAGSSAADFSVLSWLSLLSHFEPMTRGQINTQDLSFYLIVIATFILLTIRRLDRERLD